MSITFNTNSYDGFIDFIKAYAILCVLFGHTFLWLDKVGYGIWAGMQVPLFILVQSFHFYKKENNSVNIRKIFFRVFVPFFIMEVLTTGIALWGGYNCEELFYVFLHGGGFGPGAYYPWIYMQVALLLPVFSVVMKRNNKWLNLFLSIVFCEALEFICSIVQVPDSIYRLLAVRYFFLLPLGWIWVKEGIRINWTTIIISILSLVSIIYFEYISVNDEPWFFLTSWRYHRWPCYYFVAYGFTALLYIVWLKIRNTEAIISCIKCLASSSYEIFLVQMSIIWLLKYADLFFIPSNVIRYGVWVIIVWIASIGGGVILNKRVKSRELKVRY